MIKHILKKLVRCAKHYISPNKVVHSIHGIVLLKTADAVFELNCTLVDEVKEYCRKEGYEVDEIYFFTSYNTEILKSSPKKIQSKNESRIQIIQVKDKMIVHVLTDTTIAKK